MNSRTAHALLASLAFVATTMLFAALTNSALDLAHVAAWSAAGVAVYVVFCRLFGFDPHRTRIAANAPPHVHYVDRWELRLGQATLSMLGCVVVAARLLDPENFVTAVISGTLSAWTYFALRLYAGSYRAEASPVRSRVR